MTIGRLEFSLASGGKGDRAVLRIRVDDAEYLTACFLSEDLVKLVRRFREMGEEGRRFDLFFSNASPFSVSVTRRGPELYLRISDSFDGGVFEDRLPFEMLRGALAALAEAVLLAGGMGEDRRRELAEGLPALKEWRWPVTGT
jgi:hypothetical protein